MKKINEIQKEVEVFCKKYKLESNTEIRCLDLVSEVGELSKEIIKSTEYGRQKTKVTKNTELEIGDVFFCLIMLSNKLDINLEKALEKVLKKYKERFSKNKKISSF
jgi:NTP pyrophosphatase (non-canonical NTP hydrolase)